MSRLPVVNSEHLDEDQRALWDNVTNGRRGPADGLVDADGGLVGPFNAAMHAPATGRKIVELGEALRFGVALDNRLLELAVCTVGAHWRSNFEWFAHSSLAVAAGISEEVITAIEHGRDPDFSAEDEGAVYALVRGLLETGRAEAELYRAAQSHVGDRGMVELVQLVGYYCLISLTLNAFEVELPPGNDPVWPY